MAFQQTAAQKAATNKLKQQLGTNTQQSQPTVAQTAPPRQTAPPPTGSALPSQNTMNMLMQHMQQQQMNPVQEFKNIQSAIPQPQMGRTISLEDAQRQSQQQIEPLFQQNLNRNLGSIQQDAIRRGFFGQLPTEGIKARAATESAVGLAAAINASANDMTNRSQAMATDQFRWDTNQRSQNVNMLANMHQQQREQVQQGFQNIMQMINHKASREDAAWQKSQTEFTNRMQEAALTGMYNGDMTADMRRFAEQMGFEREKFDFQKYIETSRLALQRAGTGSAATPPTKPGVNQISALAWADTMKHMGNRTWKDFLTFDPISGLATNTQAQAQREFQNMFDQIEKGFIRFYTMQYYDIDPHNAVMNNQTVNQQGALAFLPGETPARAVPRLASELQQGGSAVPSPATSGGLADWLRGLIR